MSHKANDWAWTLPVRGTRQHVLLALAKKAKPKTETATPSMPELVEMTGLAESTIRAHIQALAKDGYIDVTVSTGGRHKRSTYRLLVDFSCLSTPREMDRREAGETPQERDPREAETPQELAENPPTAGPVVLRTKSGTRGGTTSAAAASDGDKPGLFDAPVRDLAVVPAGGVVAVREQNAFDAVAAWCDGYAETHDALPTDSVKGRLGKQAKELIKAGNPIERVVDAARSAGRRGFANVQREYDQLSERRDVPRPGARRASTTDARVAAADELRAYFEASGQ